MLCNVHIYTYMYICIDTHTNHIIAQLRYIEKAPDIVPQDVAPRDGKAPDDQL